MAKLTQRQADTLAFIKMYIIENGFPPTRAEIGDQFNVGDQAAQWRVEKLIALGAIERLSSKSRSIRPVKGFRVRIK